MEIFFKIYSCAFCFSTKTSKRLNVNSFVNAPFSSYRRWVLAFRDYLSAKPVDEVSDEDAAVFDRLGVQATGGGVHSESRLQCTALFLPAYLAGDYELGGSRRPGEDNEIYSGCVDAGRGGCGARAS